MYNILNSLSSSHDVAALSLEEKKVLAIELRHFLMAQVSKTGGHLSSNLGVVELTIALHSAFDSPKDKIIWDVSHQSYVHKILTGRKQAFPSLRIFGGMSGFAKRNESVHDCFGAGHSSTSLSAGLGFSFAKKFLSPTIDLEEHMADGTGWLRKDSQIVCVIGDGALTGGMAFEALNNIGAYHGNVNIILNDNEFSIGKNIGGMFNDLRANKKYHQVKRTTKQTLEKFPLVGEVLVDGLSRLKNGLKAALFENGQFFEAMGITYIGPIDGHNLEEMMHYMNQMKQIEGPVVLHVLTKKGKGYHYAEARPDLYHGVGPFDPSVALLDKETCDYSSVFGKQMKILAEQQSNIVAISAAMVNGTGLSLFQEAFPDRVIDVGIAEQHAVTMAAAMALGGMKPYVAIYSTFLQRAYDQIVHDVCIQGAPVVFCIDRAGLVGRDGETHHGVLDVGFLSALPNMTVLAPGDEQTLIRALTFASTYTAPIAIRYPRGTAYQSQDLYHDHPICLEDFAPRVIITGNEHANIGIIATGRMVQTAVTLSKKYYKEQLPVMDITLLQPFMEQPVIDFISRFDNVVTLEDHLLRGGMGERVKLCAYDHGLSVSIHTKGIDQSFVAHGSVEALDQSLGLDIESLHTWIDKQVPLVKDEIVLTSSKEKMNEKA